MKTVEATIQGISPLLMHRFSLEPIEALEKRPPEEQAELAAYRDPEGQLFIPAIAVQRALVGAATFSKGKGRASLQKQVAAGVFVSPERLILNLQTYIVDQRPVVIPATRGRIVRYRPRFDEWQVKFSIEYDEALLTGTQLRRVVDDAGSRVGLLDFRPERKGPFGRFIVTSWAAD